MAEDAFCGVLPFTRVVIHFHIHRAYLQTFATVYAFLFITMYA